MELKRQLVVQLLQVKLTGAPVRGLKVGFLQPDSHRPAAGSGRDTRRHGGLMGGGLALAGCCAVGGLTHRSRPWRCSKAVLQRPSGMPESSDSSGDDIADFLDNFGSSSDDGELSAAPQPQPPQCPAAVAAAGGGGCCAQPPVAAAAAAAAESSTSSGGRGQGEEEEEEEEEEEAPRRPSGAMEGARLSTAVAPPRARPAAIAEVEVDEPTPGPVADSISVDGGGTATLRVCLVWARARACAGACLDIEGDWLVAG
jgi:hypothetical protein